MNDAGEKIVGIIGAIIGLAVLAIIISARANTANVLASFFGGLSNLVGVAISPITGQQVSNLSGLSGSGGGLTSGFSLLGGSSGGGVNLNVGSLLGGVTGGGGSSGIGSLLGGGGSSGIGSLFGGGADAGVESGTFDTVAAAAL